tara:strand:- start:394 stop:714 length:321 start_codon:yes stop_codon:yes gene_type:complete
MGLGKKQYVNNPIVNGRTETARIATSAAAANLWSAVTAAATGSLANATGILISANASDIFLRSGQVFAAGVGIKISSGTNLFLPINSSTSRISYEGTTPDVMIFFD